MKFVTDIKRRKMSKITKTVTYEIESNGDCEECESKVLDYLNRIHCLAFGILLHRLSIHPIKQCQECKDYLAEQKRKEGSVYCKDCFYFNGELCGKCHEPKKDGENNIYSLNCQDRE
jgi:hypothetical protein